MAIIEDDVVLTLEMTLEMRKWRTSIKGLAKTTLEQVIRGRTPSLGGREAELYALWVKKAGRGGPR